MQQKRSEIFDDFAKLALEKGLISQGESMTQEEKYKDKEWKDTIQALYGIKVNDDKEDIIDRAHPKKVIISPSYDKINGLVENIKERHNIMVGIARKPNNGDLLKHRYASVKQDLIQELVQLGFSMDNKDQDELRKLADSCSDKMTKNAFLPIIPLVAGGVAAILALVSIVNHTSPSDQGVLNNCEKCILELDEAKTKLPQIRSYIDNLLIDLRVLQQFSIEYNNLGGIDARTPQKFLNAANTEQDKFAVVQKYKRACEVMAKRLPSYISMLKTYKTQEDRSYDWWQRIKEVGKFFVADDSEDAVLALETLQKSLIDSVAEANMFMLQARQQEPALLAVLSKESNQPSEVSKKPESALVNNKPETNSKPDADEANQLTNELWSM